MEQDLDMLAAMLGLFQPAPNAQWYSGIAAWQSHALQQSSHTCAIMCGYQVSVKYRQQLLAMPTSQSQLVIQFWSLPQPCLVGLPIFSRAVLTWPRSTLLFLTTNTSKMLLHTPVCLGSMFWLELRQDASGVLHVFTRNRQVS